MSRPEPVRTCVGCRQRAAKSDLVRLVVEGSGADASVVVDGSRASQGRGAHLHPDPTCLEQAVRRRAFPRAFRLPGPLDPRAVRDWLEAQRPASPETAPPAMDTDSERKRSSGS